MAFSTNELSERNGLSAEINVTPLIDVLLVMLIIFMVIVPVTPRGLNSIIPSTSSASVPDETASHPVMVQIELAGSLPRYKLDGVDVTQADVAQQLVKQLSQQSVRRVVVKADSRLDFGVVAATINSSQAAGAEYVGLLTPAIEAQLR
ncbi:MAG TPA: biopolymer transporter ExbD [Edaphobacter sp.]|nr:biopolymer transporter ExbD [Edaphobacter sp.]